MFNKIQDKDEKIVTHFGLMLGSTLLLVKLYGESVPKYKG